MKKQYASLLYALTVITALSNTMASHTVPIDKAAAFLNLKKAYAGSGPLKFLSHRQNAVVRGVASLPLTIELGAIGGAALGLIIPTVLMDSCDDYEKLLFIPAILATGCIGACAGVPMSYGVYRDSLNTLVRSANQRAISHLKSLPAETRIIIKPQNASERCYMRDNILQGNKDSFARCMNVLNPKVVTKNK